MSNEIIGTIKLINPIQQITASFSKREFVIVTSESQYPQTILLELHGSNVDIIDAYGIGEEVKVSLNFRGRVWQNPQGEEKYFNTILAWRIERVSNNSQNSQEFEPPAPAVEQYSEFKDNTEEEHDDLPF